MCVCVSVCVWLCVFSQVEQIECADFVVLNKTDLLPPAPAPPAPPPLDELVAIVSSLNPLATVVHCAQGQVRALTQCAQMFSHETWMLFLSDSALPHFFSFIIARENFCALLPGQSPIPSTCVCVRVPHIQVPLETVFGKDAHAVVAKLNVEGQHRGAVAAARAAEVRDSCSTCAHTHQDV